MAVPADILKSLTDLDLLPQGERQKAMLIVADRLAAVAGAEAIELADTEGLADSRLTNPGHWLAHEANISQRRGRRIVSSARLAARFDAIAEGIGEGVLTDEHLTVLKTCLPGNRTSYRSEMFNQCHKQLVDFAREFAYPEFKRLCEAWIGLCEDADPDAKAPEDKDLGIDFSDNLDGTTNIKGLLLTTDAELLKEALTRLAEKAKENYRRDQKNTPTPESTSSGQDVEDDLAVDLSISEYTLRPVIRRGTRYWMARAIGTIATLAAIAPRDGKTPEPLLVVLMDAETMETAKNRWANNDPAIPPDLVFRPGYTCQTLDGKPIHPDDAFRIALNHRLRRCLIDAASLKVDLGRTSRLFTGAARDAVIYRDRHCTIPGCRRPARWCEVDHQQEWQDLGRTTPETGRLYCGQHHQAKTEAERQRRHHARARDQARSDQDNTEPF
ncbi:MAG: DUF222 domain-containing protein [Acidimicrobiales bacterium]|nr:DUF222 domain-containing protein [Acidimicrobiales bacterium]